MRIRCPYCGERELIEFSYLGDGTVRLPDSGEADALAKSVDALYLRENPAGPHDELWLHRFGCRAWLRVRRDTRTHEVLDVAFADRAIGG